MQRGPFATWRRPLTSARSCKMVLKCLAQASLMPPGVLKMEPRIVLGFKLVCHPSSTTSTIWHSALFDSLDWGWI
ncbi:hypothetical protein SEVIR_1G304633v4 [Setaria viridis]